MNYCYLPLEFDNISATKEKENSLMRERSQFHKALKVSKWEIWKVGGGIFLYIRITVALLLLFKLG